MKVLFVPLLAVFLVAVGLVPVAAQSIVTASNCTFEYVANADGIRVVMVCPAAAPPPPPPPAAQDCVPSEWSAWSDGEWGACSAAGQQTRLETHTRTVVTPATGGGASCDPLSETRTGTQSCTPPPPPPPPEGTVITPGTSIQTAINAAATGASFVLAVGEHRPSAPLVPKTGQSFTCADGAIISGNNSVRHAFTGSAADVVIDGCIIEKFTNPAQQGAVHGDGTLRWIVRNNEIRNNAGVGLRVGHGMQVLNNHVHHNLQLGIGGIGDDVLVEGNEIAFNNYTNAYSWGWEAGGTKFVLTNRLIVRNNWAHHNNGPGLWTDIDNINSTIENNLVEDNVAMGIWHEISYAAVIRNNTVRRNAANYPAPQWFYGAGILISASRDVEVYGNVVEHNYHGITAVQQKRGSGRFGLYETANLNVHDNTIVQTRGYAAGVGQDIGNLAYVTLPGKNNRFTNNHYTLGSVSTHPRPFGWANGDKTDAEWRAYGHDQAGTFTRP